MTPAVRNERMLPGYEWHREYPWTAGGTLVTVLDATMHVFDQATGNEVETWSIASGHVVITDGIPSVTVPVADTIALAARKLQCRYLLDVDDGSGPQPILEGALKVQ